MDDALYKTISLGEFQHHYYYQPATAAENPTLLFIHGFPSLSQYWNHQVAHFTKKGYGIVAPDLLGYGGTSNPIEPSYYTGVQPAKHCIGILDAESIDKIVVVSHDWGCRVASRLADLYPNRHLGSVFLSAGYLAAGLPIADLNEMMKSQGLDIFSYMFWMGSEEAPRIIADHLDSFYSILYTSEDSLWRTNLTPEGECKKWLLEDRMAPLGSWAPDKKLFDQAFRVSGWYAPTNWYRCLIRGVGTEEDKALEGKEPQKISFPVLAVLTARDQVCLPEMTKQMVASVCTNFTTRDLDSGHWPMLEKPEEVNGFLEEFISGL